MSRELDYYRYRGGEFVLSIAILLASMVIVAWTFSSGAIREVPIAVIDHDGSSISRAFIRMLEATPEMHISEQIETPIEARELLEQGSIYAAVLIPQDFAKDIKTGRQTTVIGWHNAQFLTISGVLSKGLNQVTATLSVGIEMTSLAKRGENATVVAVNVEPIRPELRTLFNPFQSYQYFLVAALLPAMLQVFVMIWSVFVVGREFRDHTSGDWVPAGTSLYAAIAAKILPVFVVASVIGLGCLSWVHGYAGWPVSGSFGMLVLGWELMIVAYIVLGLVAVGLAPQLATALSFTAAFTAPAFAYAGITFPQQAMPALAQLWTYALPVRTLLRLQVEQAQLGGAVNSSFGELSILLAFIILPLPLAIWLIRTRWETAQARGR